MNEQECDAFDAHHDAPGSSVKPWRLASAAELREGLWRDGALQEGMLLNADAGRQAKPLIPPWHFPPAARMRYRLLSLPVCVVLLAANETASILVRFSAAKLLTRGQPVSAPL